MFRVTTFCVSYNSFWWYVIFLCKTDDSPNKIKESSGWCLNEYGADQNKGSVILQGKMEKHQCLQACQYRKGNASSAGCEFNIRGGCTFHNNPVVNGSGNEGYICWILYDGIM